MCVVGVIFPVFHDFFAIAYMLLFSAFYNYSYFSVECQLWHWHNLLFGGGGVEVGSMCSVYATFEQPLT